MVTRPKNIVTHLVEGTLGLKTIDCPLPGDSRLDGTLLGGFRARMPFSVWTYRGALNEEWRQVSEGSPQMAPEPSYPIAGLRRLPRHFYDHICH